ncbi:putative protein tag-278 [Palaemon carinicauda]|uniref:putative protein tag-278 n=1 Tax=Palaemon carinicauda TaxID=392227 RepID=UPI0035B611F5
MRNPFNGILGGLFKASHTAGVQEQQLECETYLKDLEGQLRKVQESFAFRMVSWLLPKRSDNSEAGIGDVPVLQRLLSSIPVVGGFWSSGQDLQECQLKVQTMERKLDMLRTDLKPTGILERFLPDFVSGTEGGTIVPQMKGGNWLTVVLVGVIVAGNVLLWKFLSTDKEEKELEELGEIIQLMEDEIEFLDKEVENDREEDEEKKELRAEIQRLCNRVEALEKEREIKTEKFSTELQDLQQTNDQLKDELSNKDASIGEYLNQLTKMEQINLEISEKLINVEGEKADSIHRLESVFEGEIEELEKTIQNQLDIIKDMETKKEIETEKFSTELQDLQQTNDHLKDELSNKNASIGDYLNQLTKMEQINLEISEKLVNVEGEKAESIHRLESIFEGEIEELEKTIQNQLDIIKEMETEKERLEMKLTEAKEKDLVRNKNYNSLLEELVNLKEEYYEKSSEMEEKNLELSKQLEKGEREKVASIHRLESVFEEDIEELKETIEKQLEIIREMKTEKERLEMKLTEAKVNDLVRNERYNGLLEELVSLKEEYYDKSIEMEEKNLDLREQLERIKSEKVAAIHRTESVFKKKIQELKETIGKQSGIIGQMKTEKKRLDLDANGHKEEKEVVGGASGVGELLGRLQASKGNLPQNNNNNLEEQKLQKETSREEETKKVPLAHMGRGTTGFFKKKIGGPKCHITFQGAKVRVNTKRDYEQKGHVTADLDIPRKFHRAIYGVEGRKLKEITRESGVESICMPRRDDSSNLITIIGTIKQVQLAADHIDKLLKRHR